MDSYDIREIPAATVAFIHAQTVSVLSQLEAYNPATTQLGPAIAHLQIPEGWSTEEMSYCTTVKQSKAQGDVQKTGDLESIHAHGGHVTYYDGYARLVSKEGVEKRVAINILPVPPTIAPRTGLERSTLFVSALFDFEQGKLVRINKEGWDKKFGIAGSALNISAIVHFEKAVRSIFDRDAEVRAVIERNKTVKGEPFYTLTQAVLSRCPAGDYWALHARIVYNMVDVVVAAPTEADPNKVTYRTVQTTNGDITKCPAGAVGVVKPKSDETDLKRDVEAFIKKTKVPPVIALGPFSGAHEGATTSTADLTLSNAITVVTNGLAFRGGASKGQGYTASNLNFMGQPSDQTRARIRMLSVLVPPLVRGVKCDVYCDVTDVECFSKSLDKSEAYVNLDARKELRFVIPREKAHNVPYAFTSQCALAARPEATAIVISDQGIPGIPSGQSPISFLEGKRSEITRTYGNKFIIFFPVCHPNFFPMESTLRAEGEPEKPVLSSMYVYAEGRACVDFRTYVSSMPDLEKAELIMDGPKGTIKITKLRQIPSAKEWWEFILKSNNRANVFFLNGTKNLNFSMNLLASTKPPAFSGLVDEEQYSLATPGIVGELTKYVDKNPNGSKQPSLSHVVNAKSIHSVLDTSGQYPHSMAAASSSGAPEGYDPGYSQFLREKERREQEQLANDPGYQEYLRQVAQTRVTFEKTKKAPDLNSDVGENRPEIPAIPTLTNDQF